MTSHSNTLRLAAAVLIEAFADGPVTDELVDVFLADLEEHGIG